MRFELAGKKLSTRTRNRLRRIVIERDGRKCKQCKHTPEELRLSGRKGILELDHIIPVSEGGDLKDVDNLQLLCEGCHDAKDNKEQTSTMHSEGRLDRIYKIANSKQPVKF